MLSVKLNFHENWVKKKLKASQQFLFFLNRESE